MFAHKKTITVAFEVLILANFEVNLNFITNEYNIKKEIIYICSIVAEIATLVYARNKIPDISQIGVYVEAQLASPTKPEPIKAQYSPLLSFGLPLPQNKPPTIRL